MCYISPVWSMGLFMAVLWVGFVNGFLSQYKVYWEIQWSSPIDPLKENGRKFNPTAPTASKFSLGNTQYFCYPCVIVLQGVFALRVNQRLPISANLPVWSHRQNLGLKSTLPKQLKVAQLNHAFTFVGYRNNNYCFHHVCGELITYWMVPVEVVVVHFKCNLKI